VYRVVAWRAARLHRAIACDSCVSPEDTEKPLPKHQIVLNLLPLTGMETLLDLPRYQLLVEKGFKSLTPHGDGNKTLTPPFKM
ncbi:hypothetical protein, partial [Nostoc sp. DedQUE03]